MPFMKLPYEIRCELLDLKFAIVSQKSRFYIGRVAHGWIVKDRASNDVKVSFHTSKGDAIRAQERAIALARDGLMPRDVPVERLERLRDYFDERVCHLQNLANEVAPGEPQSRVIRGALATSTSTLQRIRNAIADSVQGMQEIA